MPNGEILITIAGDMSDINEQIDERQQKITQLEQELTATDRDTALVRQEIRQAEAELGRVERGVAWIKRNISTTIQTIVNLNALWQASTGQQIDLTALVLGSQVASSIQLVQAQASAAAASGNWAIAALLLSQIPVLTSVITYVKSQQERSKNMAREFSEKFQADLMSELQNV